MDKLKPTFDCMIIEIYKDIQESLILPETTKGELFRVMDVGPGMFNSNGIRVTPDVREGDIVAMVGEIVTVPFRGERFQIGKASNVIAYFREEIGIPEKI